MKLKGIYALALIGLLSTGGVTAFAQVANNNVPKNTVLTANVSTQDSNKANELKEVALNAFQKNLNVTVDTNNLYERINEFYEANGHNFYLVQWCNENSEFINGNKAITYTAVIDTATHKVVTLEYHPGESKNQNYKDFSYDEAINLATHFVETNGILDGKSYTQIATDSEDASNYYFYFEYDGGKTCLVTVNKDLKQITQFSLVDEDGSQG